MFWIILSLLILVFSVLLAFWSISKETEGLSIGEGSRQKPAPADLSAPQSQQTPPQNEVVEEIRPPREEVKSVPETEEKPQKYGEMSQMLLGREEKKRNLEGQIKLRS